MLNLAGCFQSDLFKLECFDIFMYKFGENALGKNGGSLKCKSDPKISKK